MLKASGDYELIRYKRNGEICLVWDKPTKQRVTFDDQSWAHWLIFREGGKLTEPKPMAKIEGKRRDINLYTDAGYRDSTGSGSWAGVIPLTYSIVEASGAMGKTVVKSSSAAEAMAVANAIHAFLADEMIRPGDRVRVICDNKNVVNRLKRWPAKQKKGPDDLIAAIATIYDLAERYSLEILSQWVKGHQSPNSKDRHAQYNRRADLLTRQHGKKLHSERKKAA